MDSQSMTTNSSDKWTKSQVLWMRYWTPALLSFRISRIPDFRFKPGLYARLGLREREDEELVWRPFSMASSSAADHLEFIATLVPDGRFSVLLEKLKTGDSMCVDKAAFGFLTLDQLAPGRDLWLLATGTGIGPFVSILRDGAVWQCFENIILVHSARLAAELVYRDEIAVLAGKHSPGQTGARLHYLPIVTREPGATSLTGHIPQLLEGGRLEAATGCPITVETSRFMACGNPSMTQEVRVWLNALGFQTTRRGIHGQMAFEKYW